MRIRSLHVQGFRSLGDVRIDGLGPVNVFYGKNGAGKSNLLASLTLWCRALGCIVKRGGGGLPSTAVEAHEAETGLDQRLQTPSEGLAVFSHGDDWSLVHAAGERILDRWNVDRVAERWVHAWACRAGEELAARAVDAGCPCFAGYTTRLYIEWSPEEVPAEIHEASHASSRRPRRSWPRESGRSWRSSAGCWSSRLRSSAGATRTPGKQRACRSRSTSSASASS